MRAWFERLAARERRILIAGLAIALPLLFYVEGSGASAPSTG